MSSAEAHEPIHVRISPDGMTATLVIRGGLSDLELNPAIIGAMLDERGVSPSAERNAAVAAAVARAAKGDVEAVVARGCEPVHGVDARFHPAPDAGKRVTPAAAADGRVDHHAASSFVAIAAGEHLGEVLPAVAGIDGIDVSGRTLAAKQARPAHLLFDDSVAVSEPNAEGVRKVTAKRGGLLIRHGDLIRVSDKLEIATDVDFSVGNIDFPGDVTIAGGVRDCFVITAARNLEIHGLVEAATLTAGADARLSAGMAAREKGTLTVGRDLEAKYLEGLVVTIGRDAAISKEITNSKVEVSRSLCAPTCVIIGGSVTVSGECEVAQLGSEAKVATEVVVGRFAEIENLLKRCMQSLPALEDRVSRAKSRLDQLKRAVGKLTPAQAEELTELEWGASEATGKLRALAEGIRQTLRTARGRSSARLVVHRMISPGVKIWMGNFCIEPRNDVRGPVELTLSASGEVLVKTTTLGEPRSASAIFRVVSSDRFSDFTAIDRAVEKSLAA